MTAYEFVVMLAGGGVLRVGCCSMHRICYHYSHGPGPLVTSGMHLEDG